MRRTFGIAAVGTALAASPVFAQDAADAVGQGMALYGINRDTGLLSRYDFDSSDLKHIGVIAGYDGVAKTGIDGAAYIPGFQNIYAFWRDPGDSQTKLLYVGVENAQATVVGQSLGSGRITGATSALISGKSVWLGDAAMLPITGQIDINPNNSPDNEFTVIPIGGQTITRDHLHAKTDVDVDGYYVHQGTTSIKASSVRIKAKGGGHQSVTIGGEQYVLHNATTYLFTGDFTVRILNDHAKNGKAMGHWHLIFADGEVEVASGDAAESDASWSLFAVQDMTDGKTAIDFDIVDDNVIANEPFSVKVSVLGAAISYGGDYDMPVSTRVRIDGESYDVFGDFGKALVGDINDGSPHHHVFDTTFPAGTAVSVLGRSWIKTSSSKSGKSESHWKTYLTVDGASSNSPQLIVLRNGDKAPNIKGYLNQGNAADFVRDYIDIVTNTMVLDENQAIFLYELGTTNVTSSAADFQDLVVMVTLEKNAADLVDDQGAVARLLKVDHKTGDYEQIMALGNKYDGLAWLGSGQVFYATSASQLYRLDPASQTETFVGTMHSSKVFGLEFCHDTLTGFELVGQRLAPLNLLSGEQTGDPMPLGVVDLGTIVYCPTSADPALLADAYD